MKIAILALQGAFVEHQQILSLLDTDSFLVRNLHDWKKPKDGLIIPGGESTAMMKIMQEERLIEPVRNAILLGLPVFGTCAGLILLDREHLNTMDMHARRNAYGRQLGSFHTEGLFHGIGKVSMTFIRAPYIESLGAGAEVLSKFDNHIVAARQGNQLVTSFHPELDSDTRIHQYFLQLVSARVKET